MSKGAVGFSLFASLTTAWISMPWVWAVGICLLHGYFYAVGTFFGTRGWNFNPTRAPAGAKDTSPGRQPWVTSHQMIPTSLP